MRIAIIEDNSKYREVLKNVLKQNQKWKVDYYDDSVNFGEAQLGKYDVIISSYRLPTVNGVDLLSAISHKTDAELVLMSSRNKIPIEDEIESDRINLIIDKKKPLEVVEALEYIEAKIEMHNGFNKSKKYVEQMRDLVSTFKEN